jgi:hypothetical protein
MKKTKCMTMGCDKPARSDGYCSDQCAKDDYEEELGLQRIQRCFNQKPTGDKK